MNELDLLSLGQQIGVVLQDGKVLSTSILENIIGHSNATEEDAWRGLKLVCLDDYISSLYLTKQPTRWITWRKIWSSTRSIN